MFPYIVVGLVLSVFPGTDACVCTLVLLWGRQALILLLKKMYYYNRNPTVRYTDRGAAGKIPGPGYPVALRVK